ncbi:MAG: SMP-30/gluconolactonase/LRE family protein [Fibrobacteria bacterium]
MHPSISNATAVALLLIAAAGAQTPHTLPADLADAGTPVLIPRTGGAGATVFGEGVTADWQGNVYFGEQDQSNKTMQLKAGQDTAKFWRQAADNPNGMWLDYSQNRIVICQQHALVRVKAGAAFDNQTDTLYKNTGQDLNDVTGDSKGNLFFTNYMGSTLFFRNAATGETKAVFTDIKRPNGVEWDEERKRLYLHEFGANKVHLYDVAEDYSLSNKRDFDSVTSCDGITLDEKGNVYSVSYTTGIVHVRDPDAKKLGQISITGQQMTNLAFGGADFKTLYLITIKGLYKLPMKVKGYKSGKPLVSIAPAFSRDVGVEASSALFKLDGRRVAPNDRQGKEYAVPLFLAPVVGH